VIRSHQDEVDQVLVTVKSSGILAKDADRLSNLFITTNPAGVPASAHRAIAGLSPATGDCAPFRRIGLKS
jgi:hypothetical protein